MSPQPKGEEEKRRYYPTISLEEIELRVGNLLWTLKLIQAELTDLGSEDSIVPDGQKAMRGAHLTISHYMIEMLLNHLDHDRKLAAAETSLIRLTDLHGKPIA